MSNKPRVKNHKEVLEKELFTKDYFTDSDNWNSYPKDRVKVQYLSYTWEYLDKDENYQEYAWDKIKIVVSKLSTQDGNVVIKQKALTKRNWEAYAVNDEKEVFMSVDEYKDLITWTDIDFERVEKKK